MHSQCIATTWWRIRSQFDHRTCQRFSSIGRHFDIEIRRNDWRNEEFVVFGRRWQYANAIDIVRWIACATKSEADHSKSGACTARTSGVAEETSIAAVATNQFSRHRKRTISVSLNLFVTIHRPIDIYLAPNFIAGFYSAFAYRGCVQFNWRTIQRVFYLRQSSLFVECVCLLPASCACLNASDASILNSILKLNEIMTFEFYLRLIKVIMDECCRVSRLHCRQCNVGCGRVRHKRSFGHSTANANAMCRDKKRNGKWYLGICIIVSIYAFSISI